MSNADLIERLNIKAGVMENGERIAWGSDTALMREAADALAAADKRIAELEELLRAEPFRSEREKESERKLAVAREALIQLANAADNQGAFAGMSWHQAKAVCTSALAQIGGEDARS